MMVNASVINVEVFVPGDGCQYHFMLVQIEKTYVISVLNYNICYHFNKGAHLDEPYINGRLKGTTSNIVKAMLCWLEQQDADLLVSYSKPSWYGKNKFPEMNERAGMVLS